MKLALYLLVAAVQAQPLVIKECQSCHTESMLRASESLLVRMVEEKRMPPRKPLAPEAVKAIRDWVFGPLAPFDKTKSIDAFLKSGLAADLRTLIRRVTIDLTGLPPTPEELETKDSWPEVVDRLLASPRYGERWARHWLDVVRYADTSGYSNDFERPNAWRFRDCSRTDRGG